MLNALPQVKKENHTLVSVASKLNCCLLMFLFDSFGGKSDQRKEINHFRKYICRFNVCFLCQWLRESTCVHPPGCALSYILLSHYVENMGARKAWSCQIWLMCFCNERHLFFFLLQTFWLLFLHESDYFNSTCSPHFFHPVKCVPPAVQMQIRLELGGQTGDLEFHVSLQARRVE